MIQPTLCIFVSLSEEYMINQVDAPNEVKLTSFGASTWFIIYSSFSTNLIKN